MKTTILVLLIALFSLTPLVAQQAPAPAPDPGHIYAPVSIPTIDSPSRLTEAFRLSFGRWLTAVNTKVQGLFAVLAVAELSWFTVTLWLNKNDFQSAIMQTQGKLLAIGFFWTIMTSATVLFPLLVNFFVDIGRDGSGIQSLGPSEILGQGFKVAGKLLWAGGKSAFKQDFLGAAGIIVAVVAVLIAFFMLTRMFVIAQIDIYFAMSIGVIALAGGATRWTLPYVERYISFCVSSGLRMAAMYLVMGASAQIVDRMATDADATFGTMGSIISGFAIACGALLLASVVAHVTNHVSSVLGGAPAISGSDFQNFMQPLFAGSAAAAFMASGGASGAASAAAGGMRAASPAQQAATASSGSGAGSSVGQNVASGIAQVMRSMPRESNVAAPPPMRDFSH